MDHSLLTPPSPETPIMNVNLDTMDGPSLSSPLSPPWVFLTDVHSPLWAPLSRSSLSVIGSGGNSDLAREKGFKLRREKRKRAGLTKLVKTALF